MNRLDVIVAFLAQRHFLDDASRLAHQGLFFGFDDLERGVCPIDVCQLGGLRERLAQQFGVLLMQRHILGHLTFGRETTHACSAGLEHLLADL